MTISAGARGLTTFVITPLGRFRSSLPRHERQYRDPYAEQRHSSEQQPKHNADKATSLEHAQGKSAHGHDACESAREEQKALEERCQNVSDMCRFVVWIGHLLPHVIFFG